MHMHEGHPPMSPQQVASVLMEWRATAKKHNLDTYDVAVLALSLIEASIKIMAHDRADAMRGAIAFGNTLRENVARLYNGR